MSRVGKHPIQVPSSVNVTLKGNHIALASNLGQVEYNVPECIAVEYQEGKITLKPLEITQRARSLWGTFRNTINSAVIGLSSSFEKAIELVGVGYKASVSGSKITMQLGFSHDIVYDLPEGITARCDRPTQIILRSPYKTLLGQTVHKLTSYRKPEPYKGKGMIADGVFVLRKEGKKK